MDNYNDVGTVLEQFYFVIYENCPSNRVMSALFVFAFEQ